MSLTPHKGTAAPCWSLPSLAQGALIAARACRGIVVFATAVTYLIRAGGFCPMGHVPFTACVWRMLEALPGAIISWSRSPCGAGWPPCWRLQAPRRSWRRAATSSFLSRRALRLRPVRAAATLGAPIEAGILIEGAWNKPPA
jgi:branched-subunit amino acid transport protein AzlD